MFLTQFGSEMEKHKRISSCNYYIDLIFFDIPDEIIVFRRELCERLWKFAVGIQQLVAVHNDPEINISKSQLLFTSHDTNLMSPSIMRRDQFYFTEKNEHNSTRLYSLADLKGIRNDADFAKQYLAGYYGAVPMLEKYYSTQNSGENE